MEKPRFTVKLTHSRATFEALAHMQYDLFCGRNRFARYVISIAAIVCGMLNAQKSWLYYLLIAYGCYLITSTYSSANHTAHKLCQQLESSGLSYPSSRYEFTEKAMLTYSEPDNELLSSLPYGDICALGADYQNFYIFRDEHSGYMIPRSAFDPESDEAQRFRNFVEKRSGKVFSIRKSPISRVMAYFRQKENETYRL